MREGKNFVLWYPRL